MRLFVAVLFPESIKLALLCAQNALQQQGTGNFTKSENLHLTLSFIGETDAEHAAVAALDTIKTEPFSLEFSSLGNFGDLYWAGIIPSAPLLQLQAQIAQNLSAKGFTLESRTYQPHVTLCRKFCPFERADLSSAAQGFHQLTCPVEEISLMESVTERGQLIYRQRFCKALK